MAHQLLDKDTMFSVRETPWHGLGIVLDEYPQSIDEALEKSGLSWKVRQGSVLVADDDGDILEPLRIAREVAELYQTVGAGALSTRAKLEQLAAAIPQAPSLTLAQDFRANRREDDGSILGVVSDEYNVVQNEEAFRFLDALIASELHFETAGSLKNGRRVWVLARLPQFVEVGGDETATFVYVANSHDGSQAVTAAATPVRVVCANTLGWAERKAEQSGRQYRFRHTGDLQLKFEEARKVMGLTIDWTKRFKTLGDNLAREPFSSSQLRGVLEHLIPIDKDAMGKVAIGNREKRRETIVSIFEGRSPVDENRVVDTTGNSPHTKWAAANAIAEYADWYRRYTKNTDQVQRSFEDQDLKQRGLEAVLAA